MFSNNLDRTTHTGYFLPKEEIKHYNVMIDGQNVFDQIIKNGQRTYDNIWKIATGPGDDYTTGYLLDYLYQKEYYTMIAICLSKQQELNADPKANQQIVFAGSLKWDGNTIIFFIIEGTSGTF